MSLVVFGRHGLCRDCRTPLCQFITIVNNFPHAHKLFHVLHWECIYTLLEAASECVDQSHDCIA